MAKTETRQAVRLNPFEDDPIYALPSTNPEVAVTFGFDPDAKNYRIMFAHKDWLSCVDYDPWTGRVDVKPEDFNFSEFQQGLREVSGLPRLSAMALRQILRKT